MSVLKCFYIAIIMIEGYNNNTDVMTSQNMTMFPLMSAQINAELFAYFSGKGYLCTKIDDEQMDSDGSDPADECRHVGTDES